MRKSKFSESQIVGILKDAESGVPVADLLRKYGVSKATFFKWRSKYGGASVSDDCRSRTFAALEQAGLYRLPVAAPRPAFPRALAQGFGILRQGDGVQIHDAEDAGHFVLQFYPVAYGTQVIAKVEGASGLNA